MNSLFSDEKINLGRQAELDIAKALSIIFMVFLHTLMVVKGFNIAVSPAYDYIFTDILGRPFAAPIFMFCMGVGVVYSRHSQWDTMIKRGVKLYLMGILVNVFEFILPHFVCGNLLGRWDIFPIAGGLLLFCVDILAFAGLAFVIMGIMKKFKLSNKKMIIIAVSMSIIGTLLRKYDFGIDIVNLFFANFIGTKGGFTAFPLFDWFIIPIAGYVWCQYFIRAKDKSQFFRLWPIYIVVAVAYFLISTQYWGGITSSDVKMYYFMDTLDAIFCIINVHGVIGLCNWVLKYLPDAIVKFFTILSSNITNIYIAQWFYIPLTVIIISYLFKDLLLNNLITSVIAVLMIILSTLTALGYKKLRTPRK